MKKVIHIITRMDMGGAAQNTLMTCLGLDKRKFNVLLVFGPSTESKMTELELRTVSLRLKLAQEDGVQLIRVPDLIRRIDPLKDLLALANLYRIFKNEKPDIVHTHTSKAGILGRWAARLAKNPHIVHTPHGHVFFGHFNKPVSKLFFYIEKVSEPITQRIVALTDGEKNDYLRFRLTKEDKLTTIHSGVDTGKFGMTLPDRKNKKLSLGISSDSLIVGLIGWLLPIKGPMLLLDAMEQVWRRFPDVCLVYIGKGDMENDLRAASVRMGKSDKVHFLGWREDMPEIMQILDIVVLPSLNEGMGRVIVEAMAASKPVIGSNVGGIPDLIKNGVNGYLFPSGDVNALAESINCLISNPELRVQMGAEGRKYAGRFDQSYMVRQIEAMYEDLPSDENAGLK